MNPFAAVKSWARRVKRDAVALWLASRHPETPRLVKVLAIVVVAYALSPIDLIPDFIPVLGFVDDALILPGLIWLAVRLMPPALMARCRVDADAWLAAAGARPRSYVAAAVIVALWALAAWGAWLLAQRWWHVEAIL